MDKLPRLPHKWPILFSVDEEGRNAQPSRPGHPFHRLKSIDLYRHYIGLKQGLLKDATYIAYWILESKSRHITDKKLLNDDEFDHDIYTSFQSAFSFLVRKGWLIRNDEYFVVHNGVFDLAICSFTHTTERLYPWAKIVRKSCIHCNSDRTVAILEFTNDNPHIKCQTCGATGAKNVKITTRDSFQAERILSLHWNRAHDAVN